MRGVVMCCPVSPRDHWENGRVDPSAGFLDIMSPRGNAANEATLVIGTTISHYQVLRVLGKGGMGEVYEAVDEKLGRHVAIKVLLPRFAEDAEIIARFFNEARAVNLIGHPGLVQVFEFGQMPTGGAFMVMEYIAGVTLRDRLKDSERLPEMEALQISLQLASALSAAHDKDIVHREQRLNYKSCVSPTDKTAQRRRLTHATHKPDEGIPSDHIDSGIAER